MFSGRELAIICMLGAALLFITCHCEQAKSSKVNKKKPGLPQPSRTFKDGESQVFVFDGIFGSRLLSTTAKVVKKHATWYFSHPDPYAGFEKLDNGDLHWNAPISPKRFSNSVIWKQLKKGLEGFIDEERIFPCDVKGVMLLRGFSPAVYKGKGDGDLFIRIFLSKVRKNDYSELVIYNKKEEIVASVFPKYGRVAIWNDTADFIFKPPSMNVEQAEYSLLIQITTSQARYNNSVQRFVDVEQKFLELKNQSFPLQNTSHDDIYKIDLNKHLTYNFTDSAGRIVAVFDDVIPKDEVDAVRRYFMTSNSAYTYSGYDNEFEESNDNVNWIVKKDPLSIVKSRMWSYVHHCTSFLSGENQWFPYDVAMNIIQHSHHTRIHADCSHHEHEYTFLMYLSPDWNEERYGETIFVEHASNQESSSLPKQDGNEKYDTLGAVTPKYGRFAVFRNIIDHSARPPSPDFLGARYTFAVKVGRSKEIAMAKSLREVLDIFDTIPTARRLQEDIYNGKFDVYNDKEKEMFLRKNLKKYYAKYYQGLDNQKKNLLKMLNL